MSKSKKKRSGSRRKAKRVAITEREKTIIRSMTKKGATMRQIAKRIGRVPSTVWRWQNRKD